MLYKGHATKPVVCTVFVYDPACTTDDQLEYKIILISIM